MAQMSLVRWSTRRLSKPRFAEKVAIKKQVQRGDSSFEQTFWVSPEEAKEHHADVHAKEIVEKAQAKGHSLQKVAAAVQREAKRIGATDPERAQHLHRVSWLLEEKGQSSSASSGAPAPKTKTSTPTRPRRPTPQQPVKWTRSPEGEHRMVGLPKGDAVLKKTGKSWEVHYGGKVAKLPKKTTFDHAEKAIAKMVSSLPSSTRKKTTRRKSEAGTDNVQESLKRWAKKRTRQNLN